ncbi:type II toxin-antitoxin system VapC family toxin [Methylobacterium segetis]|uniref:type II toxin-antitoxin system VapC family toxin n=1 Tax=Methylobacterium segetis TaxID=2488750 RepID=UPI001043EB69|nr:type II toxin-antitoxin system VapC family toxin [Methylobacterium segetis]
MRIYLGASVLVALLTADALTARAETYLAREAPLVVVSDFAKAEFASAIARRLRTGGLDMSAAREAFGHLDTWAAMVADAIDTSASDVAEAGTFLRRLDLTLRTPDALNLALCRRASAALMTFDVKMASCAKALGIDVVAA